MGDGGEGGAEGVEIEAAGADGFIEIERAIELELHAVTTTRGLTKCADEIATAIRVVDLDAEAGRAETLGEPVCNRRIGGGAEAVTDDDIGARGAAVDVHLVTARFHGVEVEMIRDLMARVDRIERCGRTLWPLYH